MKKIRAREEAIAHENYMRKQLDEQARQLNEKDKQLGMQSKQLDEQQSLIAKLLNEIEELRRNQ